MPTYNTDGNLAALDAHLREEDEHAAAKEAFERARTELMHDFIAACKAENADALEVLQEEIFDALEDYDSLDTFRKVAKL